MISAGLVRLTEGAKEMTKIQRQQENATISYSKQRMLRILSAQ